MRKKESSSKSLRLKNYALFRQESLRMINIESPQNLELKLKWFRICINMATELKGILILYVCPKRLMR